MSKPDDRRLDAYLAGELSPEEQRALAQAALDDSELFDYLSTAAAVKATAASEAVGAGGRSNQIRFRWMLTGAAAAIAILVATVSIERSGSRPAPAQSTSAPQSTSREAEPPASSDGTASRPLILTARLGDLPGRSSPEFRSAADASRAPRSSGVVVSIENGEVAIDLGSLDGLAKGAEVQVVRAGHSAAMRLTIATVFRERSRGLVTPPNAARVGDRVEVPASLQLNALLEQALSRVAARDTDGARTAARKAVAISANARDPASAEAMNELAAVLIGSRDYADAEILLRRAQTSATGVTAVRVANNLAAVAALRGDVATAESLYRAALTMAGTVPEYEAARRSIEKNRQDLRPVR